MTIEINMRLDCGRGYTEQQFANLERGAVAILGRYGTVEHRVRRLWMGQPRHIVARVNVDDIPHDALSKVAKRFQQACLAIYYPERNEGCLVGPNASEWGPFKLEEFERFDDLITVNNSEVL